MARFNVTLYWHSSTNTTVEADSEEEALEIAREKVSNKEIMENLVEEPWTDPDVEEEDGFTTEDAVRQAFPNMTEGAVGIITSWYENEHALDDFDSLEEYAIFIGEDLGYMLDAADNPEEVEIVTVALRKIGYLEEE